MRTAAFVIVGVVSLVASSAGASPRDLPEAPSPGRVGEQVGAALYERGKLLFDSGDFENAKKLLGESLERSPAGALSADALALLRRCNEALGASESDSVAAGESASGEGPLDPYGAAPADPPSAHPSGPLDPYASSSVPLDPYAAPSSSPLDPYAASSSPLDPYAASLSSSSPSSSSKDKGAKGATPVMPVLDTAAVEGGHTTEKDGPHAQAELMSVAASLGVTLGLAVIGPYNVVNGQTADWNSAAVPVGLLGGGLGGYLGYSLSSKLTRAQGLAVSGGALWGMYNFGHIGNVFTGVNSDTNQVMKSIVVGGVVGGGLGYWYQNSFSPSAGDVAVVNSFSMLGTGAGLMVGVAMAPPETDAYSLNAALGSMAGIAAGLFFRDDFDTSVRRMNIVNLGALGGAILPWITVYPLSISSVRVTGFLSALAMGGGAYGAWILTSGEEDEAPSSASGSPSVPALVQRSGDGAWGLGAPVPRLMERPELAPSSGASLGLDLLSGRF